MKTRRRLHPTSPARTGAAGGGIIVTLVLAASALTAPPASAAQTLRVAQQDPGCSDATGAPYCSIGAANRLAAAGDVVEVGAGTYREQVSAVTGVTYRAVSSNALIVGSDPATGPWTDAGGGVWSMPVAGTAPVSGVYVGTTALAHAADATSMGADTWFFDSVARTLSVDVGGPSPATLPSVEAIRRSFGILVRSAPGARVVGFHMWAQAAAGVQVESSSAVTVQDTVVTGSVAYGVNVTGSTGITISGVTCNQNASNGVHLIDTSNSVVTGATTASNGFHGVSVTGGADDVVRGVVSHDNLRPGTRVATGISVNGGSLRALVERNTTYGNDDSGIEIYTGSTDAVVRRNLSRTTATTASTSPARRTLTSCPTRWSRTSPPGSTWRASPSTPRCVTTSPP